MFEKMLKVQNTLKLKYMVKYFEYLLPFPLLEPHKKDQLGM